MLRFNIAKTSLYPSGGDETHTFTLPVDLAEFAGTAGDRFRDDFSRTCSYLAGKNITPQPDNDDAAVLVGTEYGNLASMLRFQLQCKEDVRKASAQQFPHATTSSASTFVNIERGITGGNCTLNAGAETMVVMMLKALTFINTDFGRTAHVFLGDIYEPAGEEDVALRHPGHKPLDSAVAYAGLVKGADFSAEFHFYQPDETFSYPDNEPVFVYTRTRQGEAVLSEGAMPNVHTNTSYNAAFQFARFLEALTLNPPVAHLICIQDEHAAHLTVRSGEGQG
ncbi:hypothetical protein [Xenorhabdus griffiniae]|uniref:Uncharacterized protein n=1 Tax=Xenorhabdus griffiniae TaxID=351672 RepID=A0ABY9XJA1_9GAMM|nr:hypothetical protein [Xenorhabdus griffiniae]MBD1228690.1 hypothetical protein [Xenorhabdus griffiniae]MBE8588312.1 hypothetical protein [Xenorhabdus griffiniae]WMV72993.1 hypothetical protein QL128_02755 [Xenorhabdus griffiniae]WNH02672.1 hypothetical protein QL112_002760 [Xenorhabdus griffiniae]